MPSIHTTTRTFAAAVTATILLAVMIGTASARNISSSNQNIRGIFSRLEFRTELVTIRCPITIEGSFHSRTIPKVFRTLIGNVTRVAIKNESCTNGTAAVSNLPWHINYQGFGGTLPNIERVIDAVARFHFTVRTVGIECTYGREEDEVIGAANLGAGTGGEITSIGTVAGENLAHRVSGTSSLCPEAGNVEAIGSITLLNTTTRVRLTLI